MEPCWLSDWAAKSSQAQFIKLQLHVLFDFHFYLPPQDNRRSWFLAAGSDHELDTAQCVAVAGHFSALSQSSKAGEGLPEHL